MNEQILNNISLYGTYQIEEICSKYVTNLNQYLFYLALFNLLYFLIILRILNKIPDLNLKIIKINLNNVFETIVILCNVFISAYYLIFNYNSFIINNLKIIWFIVKIILIITIILLITFNWDKLLKIIEKMKDED